MTNIGSSAFYGCSGLTSITIPNSVTSIGEGAFQDCSGLTSINIPNNVNIIYGGTFYGCKSLTTITIPNSVTTIADGQERHYNDYVGAFGGCSSLTSITIPNSVTNIGCYAFSGCSGLTSITIPNSVTSIGKNVFADCSGLTSVTIGNSVTRIGENAFSNCSGLTFINVEAENTTYDSRNNCNAIIETVTNTLLIGCKNTIIPNSVTGIAAYAFMGCSGLTSITIPCSVTSISESAFSNCWGLTTVVLSEGIQTIQANTFKECRYLRTIILPSTIQSIGLSAFPSSNIRDVYCYATSVASTNGNAFDNSALPNATLHVPASAMEYYRTTAPWSRFGTIVKLDDVEPVERCATPSISYKNGQLSFESETEGVQFTSTIKDNDIKTYYSEKVELGVTYTITVYASKAGYENSEVATATLCWIDVEPQTEGIIDEDAVTEVKAVPVLIQTQGGIISIQGAAEGTPIAVYDTSGKQYGSTISEKDRTTISTSLQPGSVAIVKIGERSVKVLLK